MMGMNRFDNSAPSSRQPEAPAGRNLGVVHNASRTTKILSARRSVSRRFEVA